MTAVETIKQYSGTFLEVQELWLVGVLGFSKLHYVCITLRHHGHHHVGVSIELSRFL